MTNFPTCICNPKPPSQLFSTEIVPLFAPLLVWSLSMNQTRHHYLMWDGLLWSLKNFKCHKIIVLFLQIFSHPPLSTQWFKQGLNTLGVIKSLISMGGGQLRILNYVQNTATCVKTVPMLKWKGDSMYIFYSGFLSENQGLFSI